MFPQLAVVYSIEPGTLGSNFKASTRAFGLLTTNLPKVPVMRHNRAYYSPILVILSGIISIYLIIRFFYKLELTK